MTSASDNEMEYLKPSFNPTSLTVPRLRAILVSHDISYPASAKKSQLIDIFTEKLKPRSSKILAARSRIRRTSRGITDMPSSQEETVKDDDDDDTGSMPPPPVPDASRRSGKSEQRKSEGMTENHLTNDDLPSGKKSSTKHARPSDTETESEIEPKRPSVRKSRRSETTPAVKVEAPDETVVRPSVKESHFSYDNPFQSGSSPLAQSESRRGSAGANKERRKSSSRRRRTDGASLMESTNVKQEDGVVVPSVKTFEVPLAKLRKPRKREEMDDGVEPGEEFTAEEQLELVRERAANGERDILPSRKRRHVQNSSVIPRSAPWAVLFTLFTGYAIWWRQEKLNVGYCGLGRTSSLMSSVHPPEWANALLPGCEPCPQHAICYEGLKTNCDVNFVLQPHPLSLGGLIPLPPTCEPDGEKARRVKAVADRAVEELRDRRAQWECGTLTDSQGKSAPTPELDETSLREVVGRKRKRSMSQAEFEDLWKDALGEIVGRDEVVESTDK